MNNPTPTPWAQHVDEPRVIVARADPFLSLLGIDTDDTAIIFNADDAVLIVKAVNSHETLLAALYNVMGSPGFSELTVSTRRSVRDAIELARGES